MIATAPHRHGITDGPYAAVRPWFGSWLALRIDGERIERQIFDSEAKAKAWVVS